MLNEHNEVINTVIQLQEIISKSDIEEITIKAMCKFHTVITEVLK